MRRYFSNQRLRCLSLFLFIGILAGCTPRAYLIVDYKVPPETAQLKGQSVHVQVKDLRDSEPILAPAAAAKFEGFSDRYSLAWVTKDKQRILAGEFDLENLFRQAFQKRLQRYGADVVLVSQTGVPVFEVLLKDFMIDLQERKWKADVSYEVNIRKDDRIVAREVVSGQAERVKIIGRKGADTMLGEIFTEMINRLDILELFEKAK